MLLKEIKQAKLATLPDTRVPDHCQEPVAIVGVACRLPGKSNSPTAFWDFLANGGVAENEPPSSRFNFEGHFDGSMKPGTMRSPGGMYLESIDPKDIDARFFALSKADAISMDPQQRQLLEVVYEGLENAGIGLETLKGQAYGCFVGSYSSDYSDIQARDPEDRTPSWTVGSAGRAMLSNRISHFLDIKGPSMTIDTACSGSLISIDLACRYLQSRDADGAIVAGCNLYMSPEHNMDVSAIRASASPTGRCHTFDAKADGYIKSEAINMVVLKRLDDALRSRDPIRAIIRGSSTNSDGWTPGIANPSSKAQAVAIRKAYARAGISDFRTTSYLECHGTGTQAGDPIEVNGVASVFSDGRTADQPLIIGSVKSNIGHSEPAAGISGLLKTLLALETGIIPGNPTFETPNPKIDFHALNVRVLKSAAPWPNALPRRASVNSFGYGGSNAHVILDEPSGFIEGYKANHTSSFTSDIDDDWFTEERLERPKILVFSANNDTSLKSYSKAITRHLINPGVDVKLNDLAYTLSERRSHHFCRAYVVTTSTDFDEGSFKFGKLWPSVPNYGFVFTGQGAQWSQMGRSLIATFSKADHLIRHLDEVLQSLPSPPKWSLLEELTESRPPEHLRLPEFSQPLVTALQLAIVTVLNDWGVYPRSVVGHSSGEIAAAAAAGYITPGEAIKMAYFRGKAAADLQHEIEEELGMLAVGLGSIEVQTYLESAPGPVQIACENSQSSVTLSGILVHLEAIKARLQADGHFARLLQVNLAYHSSFMTGISSYYKTLLLDHCDGPTSRDTDVAMFSSVTGQLFDGKCDADYWHSNMMSPVLFKSATEELIKGGSSHFLLEVGPSQALAGPIAQIKKSLGAQAAATEYYAASIRGCDPVRAIFEVAGQIFLSGASINVSRVNEDTTPSAKQPMVVIDLPNYAWDHSIKYWHESDASKDWRFRRFLRHDLLGSKIMGTSWHAPSWKNIMRINEVYWLKDHRIAEDIVFPAAGYIAMALEALYQTGLSLGHIDGSSQVSDVSYRLRNISFSRAMVLEKEVDMKIYLSLNQCTGPKNPWHEFRISTSNGEVWTEHCRGLIRLWQGPGEAPKDALEPFNRSGPAQTWYKALGDVGYRFGPHFQKQIEVESRVGRRYCRVRLSLSDPPSAYTQSCYLMHPVCIDGCLQAAVPSLWEGYRSSINTALVPSIIDDLVIHSRKTQPTSAIAITSSQYVGIGRVDEAKNFKSHISVFDTNSGSSIFQIKGLHYNELDTNRDWHLVHSFTRLCWKPDLSFLTEKQLSSLLSVPQPCSSKYAESSLFFRVRHVLDLIAHRKPNLTVMEMDASSSSQSTWLEYSDGDGACRAACSRYLLTSSRSLGLEEVREKYQKYSVAEFDFFDIVKPFHEFVAIGVFDLVILQLPSISLDDFQKATNNARRLLHDGGYLLVMHSYLLSEPFDGTLEVSNPKPHTATNPDQVSEIKSLVIEKKDYWDHQDSVNILKSSGFEPQSIMDPCKSSKPSSSAYLCVAVTNQKVLPVPHRSVSLINFLDPLDINEAIGRSLSDLGWHVTTYQYAALSLPVESYVLVVDEIKCPVLPNLSSDQWKALQDLIGSGKKILWVTAGSQFEVSNPQAALIHGLARSARAEDPALVLKTLDVESGSGCASAEAIHKVLLSLGNPAPRDRIENEYCERRGMIYTSRILPDEPINQAENDSTLGAVTQLQPLHSNPSFVRLQCERVGALESLHFSEVLMDEPLKEDFVEVEIYAAGVNYKDVATVTGLVPEDEHRLGLEGAGIVRAVGQAVGQAASPYKIGDRVLVDTRGCFANRVRAPIEGIHLLPDSMSFEEAATLCVVYLTSIHALLDLANLQRGQTVLIHSATGGVGIAAIQICHFVGAKVYATAGSEEKRRFLTQAFHIPSEHVFSSRSGEFAPRLMTATENKGVDVILNFLTGDLLDESWRCIADRGILLEIGKKDILDRSTLSMEPFSRNASYRALDMSHSSITRPMVAGLISRMFKLIADGHITPISPVKTFSFTEIADAFRYMRAGSHIGKIVISDGMGDFQVPTRAAPRTFSLRGDVSYLIVGGLKGLCGSLAIYMVRHGAKSLVIMSRGGYEDGKSQAVLSDLHSIGAEVILQKGDVSDLDDVRRVFQQATKMIAGIVQGAMVLRDKTLESMTVEDFHEPIRPKVQGTWNMHIVAAEMKQHLDFFTMLSSASGVIGQKGQANYAAANMFLDSFAAYRHKLGLAACSVDLGVIEDVGYISERQALAERLEKKSWAGINESLLHKIFKYSILQQTMAINPDSAVQMITGIPVPQQEDSELLVDARFAGLCLGKIGTQVAICDDNSQAIQAFATMVKAKADHSVLLAGATELVNRQFTKSLGLGEPMEPAKPLSVYGLDSLSAVELRNWVRLNLRSEVSTLDILNATSLVMLCEKILAKLSQAPL